MEHRWIARKPLDCRVMLRLPGGEQVQGSARNISLGGMFVETDERVSIDAMVDMVFTLDSRDGRVYHRLPGQVVHVGRNGLGIMFCDFNPDTVRTMREILYGIRRSA